MSAIVIALGALLGVNHPPPADIPPLAVIYYGKLEGAKAPAQVTASRIFDQIPEYKQIKEKGLTSSDPEYFILLNKANEKFFEAVRKAAGQASCDVVVEAGSTKIEGTVTDLTQKAVESIPK